MRPGVPGRRRFLRSFLLTAGVSLPPLLAGCGAAAHAVWDVWIRGEDLADLDHGLVMFDETVLTAGYQKSDTSDARLSMYWLPPAGRMKIRVRRFSVAEPLLVVFTEGGEDALSIDGVEQVTRLDQALRGIFGPERVTRARL